MKIDPLSYVLGTILQIIYFAICFYLYIYLNIYQVYHRPLLIVLYIAIGLIILFLIATKSYSAALGFITGFFALVLFFSMLTIELIIHPPSEE